MAAQPSALARKFAPELDLLRGLAALLMIFNHAGYRLLSASGAASGPSGIAVFVGSFAPVLFFFATGLGVGLGNSPPAMRSVVLKALLLVVADQLFFWQREALWGMDFLGFIAVSSVLVSGLSHSRHSVALCVGGCVVLLALRYGIAPRLTESMVASGPLAWLLGMRATLDVSYPGSPWLVYPLLGFVAGRCYMRVDLRDTVQRQRWFAGVAVIALVALALAGALAWRGAVFFRWGTVSAGYFALSLGVLACACLVSMAIVLISAPAATALSLRGVASFAVIPLHYALIEAVASDVDIPMRVSAYGLCAAGIALVCFVASSWFAQRVAAWTAAPLRSPPAWAPGAVLVAAAAATMGFGVRWHELSFAFSVIGQLAVAALLGLRTAPPTPARVR